MSIDLATEQLRALEQLVWDMQLVLRDIRDALDRAMLRHELAMSVALDESFAPDNGGDELEGAA